MIQRDFRQDEPRSLATGSLQSQGGSREADRLDVLRVRGQDAGGGR